jgi:hypothetical protein
MRAIWARVADPLSPYLGRYRVVQQLVREFFWPLLAALIWVAANVFGGTAIPAKFIRILNVFFPAFFFASWLASQWFRVRKHQDVESRLDALHERSAALLVQLETRTGEVLSYMSGGDSFCYFRVMGNPILGSASLTCIHAGKYPLSNLSARIVDVDGFIEAGQAGADVQQILSAHQRQIEIGSLVPGFAVRVGYALGFGSRDRRSFNIFFTAMNGQFIQKLRMARADGAWAIAMRVERETVIFEEVSPGFPREEGKDIFSDGPKAS